ncbi:crossover junction endonuclease MUS81 isoform X1 [Octopus vulgaris]|uniref:Crossover junction endonuclease MUS81 n=1 Tax=Octopus vulgaris TaxID=6645 RepID=A0AA36AN23_OCTVU|nr:crossover junction endonuclease MUS81 isoform X1 [Octopus vulgaris]
MNKRGGELTTKTTMARKGVKKKKILPSNPNGLIVKWLKEWQMEASEKGSKVQYTYSKAINSLKKYPLPLRSGNECRILENFGKKICEMIDEKIAQHSAETGMEISEMFDAESKTSRSENVTKTTQNPSPNKKLCSRLTVHTISSSDENDTEEDEGGEEGGGGSRGKDAPPSVVHQTDNLTPTKSPSGSKTKAYVPKHRSGAYAVLVTLFRSQKEHMTKEELIREAQPLSETSFKSVGDSYYSAWSSVRTLIKKELVVKQSSPAKYSLTDSGQSLASILSQSAQDPESIVPFLSGDEPSSTTSIPPAACETFTVLNSVSNARKFSPIKENSSNLDKFLRQNSNVGEVVHVDDVVCIDDDDDDDVCQTDRCEEDGPNLVVTKATINPELVLQPYTFDIILLVDNQKPIELVLNYIVERKRMDDLSRSIVDGQFREQKFRLKQSGLSHAIYLIENHGSTKHLSVSEDKLIQAMTNTQVIDEFKVKRTENAKESVAYLTLLTRYLQGYYLKKTLYGSSEVVKAKPGEKIDHSLESASEILCNFEDFNNSAAKSQVLTVREMFAKQLLHFPNMSGAKAFAVTEKWPTPASLFEAYKACPDKVSQEQMLNNIKAGKTNRNFGPVLSRKIQQFYCPDD